MSDLDVDLESKSFEEVAKLFSAGLTKRKTAAATCGEVAVVWGQVLTQDSIIIEMLKRLETLERRPSAKWCGTFEDGKAYAECSLITDRGSLWLALRDTAQRPGSGDSGWRLIVKGGGR